MVERVSWAIPVASQLVPWRSDCLVQAIAARSWLAGAGIKCNLFIGVRNDSDSVFEAHAWLLHEGRTITGGDFSSYTPLVTPDL